MSDNKKKKNTSEEERLKQWYDRIEEQDAALEMFKNKCFDTADFYIEQECKSLMRRFKDTMQIPSRLSEIAIQLFNNKKNVECAVRIMKYLETTGMQYVADEITLYMLLAKYYIDNGNIERGKHYLVRIATNTSENYEDSLSFRDLLDTWNSYKHYVNGEIPPSKRLNIAQDEEDLDPLGEIELLLMEVGSGGFSYYLYYYGDHFNKMYNAVKEIGATKTVLILEDVKKQFPNGIIPENSNERKTLIDNLEDSGVSFEREDERFYDIGERELVRLSGIS